jgi:hypothetical protein
MRATRWGSADDESPPAVDPMRLVVDHGDPMPGPCEHERCGEASGPATDDEHIGGNVGCGAVHDADTSAGAGASIVATCGW